MLENRGEYISGQELSRYLHISRTAVWKHIKALEEKGYRIESRPGKGYCLQEVPDLLYPAELQRGLKTGYIGQAIEYYEEVDSTNKVARQLAERGRKEGTVVIAEKQTRGRGRLGRYWESPFKKGVWLSIILRPAIPPSAAPSITLLTAVAMARILRSEFDVDALIKWPNDIYIEGRKICGILTEMKADIDLIEYVILGVGLNVNFEPGDFPSELRDKAVSLKMVLGRDVSRVKLVQSFFTKLERLYELFLKEGFTVIREQWIAMNMTLGQKVMVDAFDEVYQGVAVDITCDGGLVVETPRGKMTFSSGEVTLQR